MGLCHKVEDGEFGLPWRKTETTAQLLQEDGQTVRRTEEKYRIYFGYIDSFIEDVDHTQVMYQSVTKVFCQLLTLRLRRIGSQAFALNPYFWN